MASGRVPRMKTGRNMIGVLIWGLACDIVEMASSGLRDSSPETDNNMILFDERGLAQVSVQKTLRFYSLACSAVRSAKPTGERGRTAAAHPTLPGGHTFSLGLEQWLNPFG